MLRFSALHRWGCRAAGLALALALPLAAADAAPPTPPPPGPTRPPAQVVPGKPDPTADPDEAFWQAALDAYNQDDFPSARAAVAKLLLANPAHVFRDRAELLLAEMLVEEGAIIDGIHKLDALASAPDTDPTVAMDADLQWCRAVVDNRVTSNAVRAHLEMGSKHPLTSRQRILFELEIDRYDLATGHFASVAPIAAKLAGLAVQLKDPNERALIDLFLARVAVYATDNDRFRDYSRKVFDAQEVKPNLRIQAAVGIATSYLTENRPAEALDWLAKADQLPRPLPWRAADIQRFTALADGALNRPEAAYKAFARGLALPDLTQPERLRLWLAEASVALDQGDVARAKQAAEGAAKLGDYDAATQDAIAEIRQIAVGGPAPKLLFDPAHPDQHTDWFYQWRSAIQRDDPAAIKDLAAKGIDPSANLDQHGTTALIMAAGLGRANALTALLDLNLPVDPRDYTGRTPLLFAAQAGSLDCCQILAAHHADLQAKDQNGDSALHLAAAGGFLPVVQWLVDHNLDVHALGRNDFTPLHYAAEYQRLAVIKFLIAKGANPDAHAAHNVTPTMLAGRDPTGEAYKYLLSVMPKSDPRP
ncbi:MAG: ankyrin repeat domain-containing protein [Planctomycetota bacterium]